MYKPATLLPEVRSLSQTAEPPPTVFTQVADAEAVAANVSTGAVAVVDAIHKQASRAQVLLLAILPRGDRTVEAPSLKYLQPSK